MIPSNQAVINLADLYNITTILKDGKWKVDGVAGGIAYQPAILEHPRHDYYKAKFFYRRYIFISRQSLKKTELRMGRIDEESSDAYYIYLGTTNTSDLEDLIDNIRDIFIRSASETGVTHSAIWTDTLKLSSTMAKYLAEGVVRKELYGGVRNDGT
jgi:hypothetical protein